MADNDALYSNDPARRLEAARALSTRARKKVLARAGVWPPDSPGCCNAWLLFVTSKPPTWRDRMHPWVERPLTIGQPHEGFLYPDPIGFWDEVRRWAVELFRLQQPTWSTGESLSLTSLVHVVDEPAHLAAAERLCAPRTIVFLDEGAWQVADLDVATTPFAVPDPHRAGQVYEGWWGTTDRGVVVGKAPQHPTMHRLYRAEDITTWLRAAPRPRAED